VVPRKVIGGRKEEALEHPLSSCRRRQRPGKVELRVNARYLLEERIGLIFRSLRAITSTAAIRSAICRRVKPSGENDLERIGDRSAGRAGARAVAKRNAHDPIEQGEESRHDQQRHQAPAP